MPYFTRRQTRAAMAAAAGAVTYLAASEIGSRKLRASGLFILASVAMAGTMSSHGIRKAYAVEARLNDLLNNGGSFGGTTYTIGDHHVTGSTRTDRVHISGTELTINHGAPGYSLSGAPGSYSAGWETNLMHFVSDVYNGLQAANVLQ